MIDTGIAWLGNLSSYLRHEEAQAKVETHEVAARSGGSFGPSDEDPEEDFNGYGYMVQRQGSIALVNVNGDLTGRDSWYNRYFGMVSYAEVRNAATAAANDSAIRAILMNYDSPGGAAAGAAETAAHLDWLDNNVKPVHSHTSKTLTSAAYWLGSAGRRLTATDMSTLGSIGVVLVHKEYTVMLEKAGIKATVFREGKYKALGNPYEKLTPLAKDTIQKKLSDYRQFFVEAVSKYRGLSEEFVSKQIATGAEFWGPEALRLGMVDKIMTLEAVVNQLDGEHNSKLHEVRHTQ